MLKADERGEYEILKILSHNVIQVMNHEKNEECIFLGKGIGFGKKPKDIFNESSKIERKYFITDQENLHKYQLLLEKCDEELYFFVEEYIEKVQKTFKSTYDETLHIGLLDHLNFSLYRYHNQIALTNIFMDEMSLMYEEEYEFAVKMLEDLNQRLDVELPKSEASFIALHLHASIKGEKPSVTALYLKIIGDCLSFIEKSYSITLDAKSIERTRLITHLKFALKRATDKMPVQNVMVEAIKNAYPKTFALALELTKVIQENYGIILPEGEVGYLAMHMENIIHHHQ
ncbi:MAG: PRD domain-containing protein [Clostridium sp.]|nr:PRD domain-containing protein [Clostridium sp.]